MYIKNYLHLESKLTKNLLIVLLKEGNTMWLARNPGILYSKL